MTQKTKIRKEEWQWFAYQILKHINFVSEKFISKESLKIAVDLCKDTDIKDTLFVALALDLEGYLWTGDKELVKGLKSKGFNKVLMTEDLLEFLK